MRVLFPTDGSKRTEPAFDRMLDLLGYVPDLEVTILTLRPAAQAEDLPASGDTQAVVDRCVETGRERGLTVHARTADRDPEQAIVDAAVDHDVLAIDEIVGSDVIDLLDGTSIETLSKRSASSVLLIDGEPR